MRSRPQPSPSPCRLTPTSASPPELSFAALGRGNLRTFAVVGFATQFLRHRAEQIRILPKRALQLPRTALT
jgi:hypothetical protein